ncbi:MAG TPA: alpha/beta hydrolase [Thermoanaerobaculia bacterium]|nr:alpha/beta hydrolase [Thermoanaerobaculia bacterium]
MAKQPEPPCTLVRFQATDGVELSGLLYEPRRRADAVVAFVHGTGGASIFESSRTNLLAHELVRRGLAFFPFNNRGAHLIRRLSARKGRETTSVDGGMAHERIRDCVFDLDGAARLLRHRGYRRLYLAGHSTGANKVAVYDHYKPRNPYRRYILLGGGDDSGLFYANHGPRRFAAALAKARERIRERRGHELARLPLPAMPMSWRSLYDMINPDGDYSVFPFLEVMRGIRLSRRPRFRYLKAIRKPTLVLYGENDAYCYDDVPGCVAALVEALGAKPNFEYAILAGADHGFKGKERELGGFLAAWCLTSS